jgi:hypothetical protein
VTMRREIGSEFWDVPTKDQQNNLFPESTLWFLSGRSALQAIIKELGEARSVSLPSWCCDSMIKPFVDAGLKVHFYPVYWSEGQLVQEWSFDSDILFLIDYFGYTGAIPDLSGYKGTVIRDVTHSIFSASYSDADFYFGSLRKWCGAWTGGYAWGKDGHRLHTEVANGRKYVSLREKAMHQKAEYISGQREDKGYLQIFDEAEELLESVGSFAAADRDVQMAKKIDVATIRNRRRTNGEALRSAFPDWLIFSEMSSSDVPMFVPVLVPDGKRNKLRRYLIKNEIYCPIHWPVSDYHRLDGKERFIYDNELSLVCDQRYTEEDMYRMVETIKAFWKEA